MPLQSWCPMLLPWFAFQTPRHVLQLSLPGPAATIQQDPNDEKQWVSHNGRIIFISVLHFSAHSLSR